MGMKANGTEDKKPDAEQENDNTGSDDTDEQDGDQDESEDQDTSDQGDDSNSDSEGDSEEEQGKLTDPNKLPPQLKLHFKRMQASYTRAMQKARAVTKQADAFETLSKIPEFNQWLEDYKAKVSKGGSKKSKSSSDEDSDDDDAPVRKLIREELKPITSRFQKEEQEKNTAALKVTIKGLKDSYGEELYELHEDATFELAEKTGLSLEDAFLVVAKEDLFDQTGDQVIKRLSRKKRASMSKPNNQKSGNTERVAKSIAEAFAMAKESLGQRR